MFYDFLDWLSYWTVRWAISAVEWIQRTTLYAGRWFWKCFPLFDEWWGAISFYVQEWIRFPVDFGQTLIIKLYKLLMEQWDRVQNLVQTWYMVLQTWIEEWRERIRRVFSTWWEWVSLWFSEWCEFFVRLFEEHREKIVYCLTEGWPRIVWFVIDRFELLFADIEGHLSGWETFVDDPAKALWDWFEPRAQELVADFLVRVWGEGESQ